MNQVNLRGRLTAEPELRYTESDKAYTRFTLAVNRPFKKDETDFFNIVAWSKTGEFCSKYFKKGKEPTKTSNDADARLATPSNLTATFNGSNLGAIPLLNTNNVTNMNSTFRACKLLVDLPQLNTSKVEDFGTCFAQCSNLKDIPVLDTSSVIGYGFNNTFSSCPLLSNESLNNILLMCINTKNVYSNLKTLSSVGLTSTQATTCQTLSNYQAFLDAGWTTGY